MVRCRGRTQSPRRFLKGFLSVLRALRGETAQGELIRKNFRSFLPLPDPLEQFNRKKDDRAKTKAREQVPQAERGRGESPVEKRYIDHSYLQGKRQQHRTQHGLI